jgi:hypothetical protein
VNRESKPKKDHTTQEVGFTRCPPTKKCKFCKTIGGDAVITSFPACFKLPPDLKIPKSTCESENVVYLCGCTVCGDFYVGQTGGKLKVRGLRHVPGEEDKKKKLQSGRDKEWSEPRWHFAEKEHNNAFFCAPLRVLRSDTSVRNREKIKNSFITRLKPSLNVKGAEDQQQKRRSNSSSPARSLRRAVIEANAAKVSPAASRDSSPSPSLVQVDPSLSPTPGTRRKRVGSLPTDL